MTNVKELLAKEPVLIINAVVGVATVAAAYGLDVDPQAVGATLGALFLLAGITRSNVWAPASVDEATKDAKVEVLDHLAEADAEALEERRAALEAEGYNVQDPGA